MPPTTAAATDEEEAEKLREARVLLFPAIAFVFREATPDGAMQLVLLLFLFALKSLPLKPIKLRVSGGTTAREERPPPPLRAPTPPKEEENAGFAKPRAGL